jgi:hypothetical protein
MLMLLKNECTCLARALMYLPPRTHPRIEFNFSKGAFVAAHVLLQQPEQGLGLLRAQVDALKVADLDLRFGLLLQCAKCEKEIPDVDPHLHAVRVGFPVFGRIDKLYIRLWRKAHRKAV